MWWAWGSPSGGSARWPPQENKICLMIWLYYMFETAIAAGTLTCLALTAQAVRKTAKLMQEMRDLRVAQTQAQRWTSQQSQYA